MKKYIKLVVVAIIIFFFLFFVIIYNSKPGWDFRNNLWAPASLLVRHLNPYHIQLLFENSNAVWFPTIIGPMFFLGFIPLKQANNIWLLINITSFLLIINFSFLKIEKNKLLSLLLIFALLIFPPTIKVMVLGQASLIICLLLILIMKFDDNLYPFVIGILFSISLSKPQLVIFFLPAYLMINIIQGRINRSIRIIGFIFIGIFITCIPFFIYFQNWIPDLIVNLKNNPNWMQPTLYSLFPKVFGRINATIGLMFFLFGIILNLYLPFRLPPKEMLMWSLTLTTVFSPYIWSWDFVLLIPLSVHYYTRQQTRLGKLFLLISYGINLAISYYLILEGNNSDDVFWWVPIMVILTVLLNEWVISRRLSQRLQIDLLI